MLRSAFLGRKRKIVWTGGGLALVLLAGGYRLWLAARAPSFEARSFLVEGESIAPTEDETGVRLRSAVELERLRADVARLAGPDLAGRLAGGPGATLAARHVSDRLAELGLEPVFGGSFEQEIVVDGERIGKNVAARIPGTDPRHECVVLVAHYDHLGVVEEELHPGADANGSGVAMALEIARLFAAHVRQPRHDVVFLFADAAEKPHVRTEAMGSVFFVQHGPVPPERIRLGIVLDVLGGSPLAKDPDLFFVMGAETSPDLVRLVRSTPQPPAHARSEFMSVAMVEAKPYAPWVREAKSDYYAFRLAGRPFLFLTSGTTPRYQQPEDTPESLAYEKLAAETGFVADLARRAAMEEGAIRHFPDSVDQLQDVRVALRILDLLLETPGEILAETLEALRQDRERVLLFREALERGETLDGGEYRILMLVGLRIQCVLARPNYTMCVKF